MPNDFNVNLTRSTNNEWNNLLNGIIQGGSAVAQGLIQKNQRDEQGNYIRDEYKSSVDYLKNSFRQIQEQQENLLSGTGQDENKRQPIQEYPDPKYANNHQDLYEQMINRSLNLTREGGQDYATALGKIYDNLFPTAEKKSDFTLGDTRYTYDSKGNVIPLVTSKKDEKEKPFQLSPDAEIIPYADDNGETKYGFFEPDPKANDFNQSGWKFTGVTPTQDQIDAFNNSGKYAPKKTGGRRSGRGRGSTTSKRTYTQEEKSLAGDLAEFGKMNKNWNSWQNDDEKKEKYKELQRSLLGYFGNDYDALNKYAEQIFTGDTETINSAIDEILGNAETEDAELETIDDIFDDEELTGEQATLIYEGNKDSFRTKAGRNYFKEKYLNKIGAK
ncbi:MAG TPA: hypothetical protein PL089_15230 [Ignavibacteria bacterium]|mgnify:CR=1 FL=1|nr:hypothetical protein [Ignavibacteria bacterium]